MKLRPLFLLGVRSVLRTGGQTKLSEQGDIRAVIRFHYFRPKLNFPDSGHRCRVFIELGDRLLAVFLLARTIFFFIVTGGVILQMAGVYEETTCR